jgi:predicted SAM-dependent methyltransferase
MLCSMKKVNLGCGDHTVEGWINFDNSPNAMLSRIPFLRWFLYKCGILSEKHYKVQWPKDIRIRQLTRSLPFSDNEVDYFYTSHFIEHLSYDDAIKLFREVNRSLRVKGVLRIVVPDLNFYIQKYLFEKGNTDTAVLAANNFLQSLNIITKSRDPHLWMYDADSIKNSLKKAGFQKIERCEYRKGKCVDIEELDYLPEDSLFIEAIK